MFYNIVTVLAIGAILFCLMQTPVMATGFTHFKPDNGATVLAGKPLVVNGTSAPSNSTHPSCTVQLSTNQGPYVPAKALGPGGTSDFTKWTVTTPPMRPGHNELQAQFECVKPGGASGISLIHHLVHNVTGTETDSGSSSGNGGSGTHTAGPVTQISPPTVG